jgi:Uma2 family endonuclease
MKVQVQSINRYYYPDVFVTCDERDRSSLYSKSYPTLIIEVLSPSTAAFDRGRKFANYRRLETLQEYVLVDTEQVAIECFRRDLAGNWLFHAYGEGDEVHLASVNFKCAIALIYEDTLPLPTSQEL